MCKNQNEKKRAITATISLLLFRWAPVGLVFGRLRSTVFGSAFCPLRIVANQPCRPESFGLLHTTKHRTKYISFLLKLANTKTSNNLLGWWDFAQQNLLRHHRQSNAKVCLIIHCCFAPYPSDVFQHLWQTLNSMKNRGRKMQGQCLKSTSYLFTPDAKTSVHLSDLQVRETMDSLFSFTFSYVIGLPVLWYSRLPRICMEKFFYDNKQSCHSGWRGSFRCSAVLYNVLSQWRTRGFMSRTRV